MTITTVAPLSEHSGSALRFGLLNMKPIQVTETVKKSGLKFRITSTRFESPQSPKSFEELAKLQNEAILSTIDIPDWFEFNKLVDVYSKRSISRYNEDEELQEMIESIKNSERKGRPLLNFIQFMIKRFEAEKDNFVKIEANRFLRSNFPLSFYTKFVVYDKTYYDLLKVLERIVRLHEFQATRARSFTMYKKKINELKGKISPILDNLDQCVFACSSLKKFLMIWNSKEYGEVTNPKFLYIGNVDKIELHRLSTIFNNKIREVKGFLLHYDPNVLLKQIDSTDDTTQMLGKLLMFPSSSYRI